MNRRTLVASALAILAAAGLLVSLAAWAQTTITRNLNLMVLQSFWVGTPAQSTTDNRITRVLGGSATIDFASSTIVCTDSSAITVTGAVAGDACFVGAPAAATANSNFTCFVSAADAVKVRHCAAGTAADPASATYYVRVISSQ